MNEVRGEFLACVDDAVTMTRRRIQGNNKARALYHWLWPNLQPGLYTRFGVWSSIIDHLEPDSATPLTGSYAHGRGFSSKKLQWAIEVTQVSSLPLSFFLFPLSSLNLN